jgi:hypothetical protein
MVNKYWVLGATLISQIVGFLNAVFEPFKGTMFVFDEWVGQASKTAVAVGVVIVAVVAGLNVRVSPAQIGRRAIACLCVTLLFFILCAALHLIIKSGFAPSEQALFITRDIVWMVIYIIMLVMAGVTMVLAVMMMYSPDSTGSLGKGGAQPTAPKNNA